MSKMKCPFFERKVSSYRYSGIKCSATFTGGETMGSITLWSKEYREKFIAEKCNGDYEQCGQYKENQKRGGRLM